MSGSYSQAAEADKPFIRFIGGCGPPDAGQVKRPAPMHCLVMPDLIPRHEHDGMIFDTALFMDPGSSPG
jgi:hypothetical protein